MLISLSPANGEVASRCTANISLNINDVMEVARTIAERRVLEPAYLVSTVSFGRTR